MRRSWRIDSLMQRTDIDLEFSSLGSQAELKCVDYYSVQNAIHGQCLNATSTNATEEWQFRLRMSFPN